MNRMKKEKVKKWLDPLVTALLIMLITISVSGQSGEREKITDTIVTPVKNMDDIKAIVLDDIKTVILIENDNFIVKVSLSDFKNNIDNWLKEYPKLEKDKKLLDIILEQAKNNHVVNASKLIETDGFLVSRLEYRIASLLENGLCVILDKKSNEIVPEIKLQSYSYYCGPLCGHGGRRFFVNEILILKVMDWIS